MDLNLSEEQRLIVDSAAEFLASNSTSARVRQAFEHAGHWDELLWQALSELAGAASICPSQCKAWVWVWWN